MFTRQNSGKVWVVLVVILAVILLVGIGIFKWYISGYNRAVSLDEGAKTAWSNVDTTLQRRLDLIPNLIETVKGYASHEKELFEDLLFESHPADFPALNHLGS